MKNVIETFETKKIGPGSQKVSTKKPISYELERCSKSLFNKTNFEEEFYDNMIKDKFVYCVNDEKPFLKGTRNDQILKNDYAMFIYEIERCHEDLRNKEKVNPMCND